MAFKEKSEAIKYNNDYIRRAYDRINLTVPKGQKEAIQAAAAARGESVNAYIYTAIEQRMEREQMQPGGGYDIQPPDGETIV